jgi:hypothetical protein
MMMATLLTIVVEMDDVAVSVALNVDAVEEECHDGEKRPTKKKRARLMLWQTKRHR